MDRGESLKSIGKSHKNGSVCIMQNHEKQKIHEKTLEKQKIFW